MYFEGIWYVLLDYALIVASREVLLVLQILFEPPDILRCGSTQGIFRRLEIECILR